MGQHFMLLMSIYVLYSNVSYIYPVACLVEIKLFQIVSVIPDCTTGVGICFVLLCASVTLGVGAACRCMDL